MHTPFPTPASSPVTPGEEAFLRLLLADQRALLRFILRFVPVLTDARDVLQETLVTLWNKRGEFDPGRSFLPWACGIARFKVREFWRALPRWEVFAADDLMEMLEARHQELIPELSVRSERLPDCLARLPETQRALLKCYYEDEEPIPVLAQRLGRTQDALYKLLQRIRRALQDCIERNTMTHEGGTP